MAQSAAVEHRALDGVAYHLAGPLDLTEPATSVVEVAVDGRLHEFTAGPPGLADAVADSLGISEFDSELSFRGGTLRTATTSEYDGQAQQVENPTLVVWQGRRFSLVTRIYRARLADVLALLRPLGIAEHQDGIVLAPDSAVGARWARPATVIKEVPGLGLVEMSRRTREHTAQLPPWEGASVRSGELFRDSLSDGNPFFVLSGPELWATIVPLAGTTAERVPALVGGLEVRTAG
ncbi:MULTISPECIES: hypothetical protein [unclassified Streptomyces]|uniref:hypothetical protein n=1 Tax=unclassified Streptomyces TaxID=2593676 RepID=UPI000376ED69|nr:hypothetical protein [Streptomyces sp. LaPpAH-202]MYW56660.1 hypothetical protein [Streptomyces sp. SID8370]MYW84427.1 hypothetical protein [Streptomyces sp. SID8371]